jgi:hypothetical protein
MGVIIDIVGSFIVRGIILTIIINMMISLNSALSLYTERAILYESITTPSQVISSDFKMAGYGVLNPTITGKKNEVTLPVGFTTIHYYLDSSLNKTYKLLYRDSASAKKFLLADNVKTFQINYFDKFGADLGNGTFIDKVVSMRVSLILESPNTYTSSNSGAMDNVHQRVTWEEQIFPPNLQ